MQIYLFANAHINLVLIANDLPLFFRKHLKNRVRATFARVRMTASEVTENIIALHD
jgi:hypothetical protein